MDHAFTPLDWHMLLIHPAGMDAEVVFMFVERCGLRVGDQRELGTPGPLLPVSRLGRQSVTHLFYKYLFSPSYMLSPMPGPGDTEMN